MPRRGRYSPGLRRRHCWTRKNRFYASFPYPRFHPCISRRSRFSVGQFRRLANFIIEYNWWKEVAQVNTWLSMLWYSIAPTAAGALLAFIALYVAHARGLHFAGIRQRDYPFYSRLVPIGLAVIALLFASSSIDFWTVMRFFGSRGLAAPPDAWQDHVFSHALAVLPVRSAFLFGPAGICVCVGNSVCRAVLGDGPGMAVGRTLQVRPAVGWAIQKYQSGELPATAGCNAHRRSCA